jgi:spoIIIJ-associated protein
MSARGDSEAAARVRRMLEEIVGAVGADAEIEVLEDATGIQANLDGEDLGLLIGRHGQTIDAIQHLAYRIAYRGEGERKRVTVDAAGYRDRRAALLQQDADEAVEEVLRTGEAVSLDAMNAVERRVVHEYLRDREGIETFSEGDEPDRHLVVAPADAQ